MTTRYKDLTNERYGRLQVISYSGNKLIGSDKKKFASWHCLCDCGVKKIITAHQLKHGTTSCGCYASERRRASVKLIAQKGWESKTQPLGDAVRKEIITGYKSSAKVRNLKWSLTDMQVEHLLSQNCHYCGVEPNTVRTRIRKQRTNIFKYNGIDRIDSSKGYLLKNVVSSCKLCNYVKRSLSYEEFSEWIDRLAKYRIKKELKGGIS